MPSDRDRDLVGIYDLAGNGRDWPLGNIQMLGSPTQWR
jgi:hypothetical protein